MDNDIIDDESQDDDATPRHAAARRRSRKRTIILVVAAFLTILVIIPVSLAVGFMTYLNTTMSVSDETRAALSQPGNTTDDASQPFYSLLVGTDRRTDTENGRSDTMVLARVDPEGEGRIDLISIPRDMMIDLDGHTAKLNAAYSIGGSAKIIKEVRAFTGVPITHYAEVDFDKLVEVIDLLGGVTVDVPESFQEGNSGVSLNAGEQTLTGEQALGFARERYNVSGGDYSRMQAQRLIITAIIRQSLDMPADKLLNIIRTMAQGVNTDMSVADIAALANRFRGKSPAIGSASTPSYAFMDHGVSYVGVAYDEWRTMMQRVDAGLGPKDDGQTIPERQLENEQLGSAANATSPRDYRQLMEQSLNSGSIAGDE
ncbi:LCP family protein [Bifidobacterium sp. CP2]|uniref:LCP family protein n=1 Tax=Bifidobacterium sp. CP2 TaxID=2809025 RepID=UPI001C2FAFF8|nr:LCP family protein [Bifidobacterium sp. CP2]